MAQPSHNQSVKTKANRKWLNSLQGYEAEKQRILTNIRTGRYARAQRIKQHPSWTTMTPEEQAAKLSENDVRYEALKAEKLRAEEERWRDSTNPPQPTFSKRRKQRNQSEGGEGLENGAQAVEVHSVSVQFPEVPEVPEVDDANIDSSLAQVQPIPVQIEHHHQVYVSEQAPDMPVGPIEHVEIVDTRKVPSRPVPRKRKQPRKAGEDGPHPVDQGVGDHPV
jgi:hypothetical protein